MGFLDYGGGAIDESSQGFSPRKSTVPFSTVTSLGKGSPAKSPKRKPQQGGATDTDSEVGKALKTLTFVTMPYFGQTDLKFSRN